MCTYFVGVVEGMVNKKKIKNKI